MFVLLMPVASSLAEPEKPVNQPQLTLWLIPFEPPVEASRAGGRTSLKNRLASFNRKWAAFNITVRNTSVDWMVDQLVVWNPEYDRLNWTLILGQEKTLTSLGEFARKHHVYLRVRFLTWNTMTSALEKMRNDRSRSTPDSMNGAPDVIQIGSTWVPYFTEKKMLLPPDTGVKELSWRRIDHVPVSLPYTTDVRLMFYWKRLPGRSQPFRDALGHARNWQEMTDALSKQVLDPHNPSPPMVMPIGLTFNLFHDFIPLVWASGEPFFVKNLFGTRTSMGSNSSLKVPLMISEHATVFDTKGLPHRTVSFPEMSQESAARYFMDGVNYAAVIQPAAFISRWYRHFIKYVSASPGDFWDHAGVTLLPSMFKGGTDLMVADGTGQRELAFRVVRYLATDDRHTAIAAENGYLPAQNCDFGLGVLLDSLGGPTCAGAREAISLIQTAIQEGREYPPVPESPTKMESIEVLEAMQMLWRRIGEGNAEQVRRFAGKAEQMINSRIYWPTAVWGLIQKLWPAISFFLVLAFLGMYLYSRKISWGNRLLRIASEALRRRDYVMVSRAGAFVSDCHRNSEQACVDFSKNLHELRTRTLRLEENIRKDLETSGHRRLPVSSLINEAWENGVSQYRVARPSVAHSLKRPVIRGDLDNLKVRRLPYVLVTILQDWFYNCMKDDRYVQGAFEIGLWGTPRRYRGLAVHSPVTGDDAGPDYPHGPLPQRVFALMCEQSKAAYGRVPVIRALEARGDNGPRRCTVIYLPVPLVG